VRTHAGSSAREGGQLKMAKLPTRSPTHAEVEPARLASMGLELEEIAGGEVVALPALIELAEDRGRPASHYVAAIPLATELRLEAPAQLVVRVCVGTCQRYGALDLLEHLLPRAVEGRVSIAPVTCLDRCDRAPACAVGGFHGELVLAPATTTSLDEALGSLA
jgi:NADH:ubiquinone oxidoreductase subunit E